MCNVRGLNNPTKQDDVICWHKDMNNLVSIFMESKLKGKVCPWLTDKFDGVWVFTSGLDSGSMGAGVLIIINSSLAKHVCKISEVPDWLLSIKLLFKNKLSVSILGLYAGASSVIWFSQAGKINSLIARAINESSFVILGGDFNEDSFRKCASFKKCLELGLVNFLIGSLTIKMLTWANSRGVMKTIDYVFVSPNLVNSLVHCGVSDIGEYFDTDHQAVSKFDVKNASEAKWLEFKNTMAANTTMLSGAFGDAVKFSDLGAIFHKLELLVSKLDNLDSASASIVRSMFFSGAKFDDICSALAKAKRLYYSSKLLESKCAEESHIRQAITNRIESFELDKGCTIRSVLECPFYKVVLDHLVMNNKLVLEPDLVKSKVDAIIEGWTRKCVVVNDISNTWSRQYKFLNHVFDDVFSGVISEIDFDELYCVITSLPDGKAAGLLDISNELWKCCDKSVLGLLLVFLNSCLSYQTNCVMTDFGLTNGYRMFDELDQGEVFSPLLWHIFYDSLLCEVKHQESICGYRLNSHFVSGSGHTESQAGLSTFFVAGAFVDNTIWVGSS
ncbi:hypothetical protein G9A89_011339 [Geosiphon pyriformis]|nr:hypothetical protein G9A89_011339 [Geosiphon pyriformis]